MPLAKLSKKGSESQYLLADVSPVHSRAGTSEVGNVIDGVGYQSIGSADTDTNPDASHSHHRRQKTPLLDYERHILEDEEVEGGHSEEEEGLQQEEQREANVKLLSWRNIKQESKILFHLSWPVVVTNLLQFSITSISVLSLGHINTESLAAISLASLFVNTTGTCIAQGIASALDTLCSQR